jgi:site-specific DNA recombinase
MTVSRHEAILDRQTFERLQDLLGSNRITRRIKHPESGALLQGKLFDDRGNRMGPSFSSKNGVRYASPTLDRAEYR